MKEDIEYMFPDPWTCLTSLDAVLKHSAWDFGKLSKEEEVGGGGLVGFLPFQLSGTHVPL